MNDWLQKHQDIAKTEFDQFTSVVGGDRQAAAILCGFNKLSETFYYALNRMPEYLVHELAAYNNPLKDIASALGDIAAAISEGKE
jgi:hypothetical protein